MTVPAMTATVASRFVIFVFAVLALAACRTSAPAPKMSEIKYAHLPKIHLDVAELQIVAGYVSPRVYPHIDHLFPTSPQAAFARWARRRVFAVGASRRALIVVRRAAVIEEALVVRTGLGSAFRRDPSARYDAVIEVAVEIRSDHGGQIGIVEARAKHSRQILEGTDDAARDVIWQEMTQKLLDDVVAELNRQLRRRLTRFVK